MFYSPSFIYFYQMAEIVQIAHFRNERSECEWAKNMRNRTTPCYVLMDSFCALSHPSIFVSFDSGAGGCVVYEYWKNMSVCKGFLFSFFPSQEKWKKCRRRSQKKSHNCNGVKSQEKNKKMEKLQNSDK